MENIGLMLMGSITSLAQLFIIGICLYYLIKKPSIEGWFLLLPSLVMLLMRLCNMIVVPILFQKQFITPDYWSVVGPLMSLIGFFAEIIFGIGLLMLVHKVIKKGVV